MEKTSFFKSVFYSVTKFSFANEIVYLKRGVGYLFLLSLLISSFITVMFSINCYIYGSMKSFINESLAKAPEFDFKKGYLSMDLTEPYVIENDTTIMIIENSQEYSLMEKYDSFKGNKIYINNTTLLQKTDGKESKIPLSKINISFSKAELPKVINILLLFLVVLYFVVNMFSYFIGGLFLAFVVSIIGIIIKKFRPFNVDFYSIYSLSIFSLTPFYIIRAIIISLNNFSSIKFPTDLKLLGYLIMTIYLFMYLKSLNEDDDNYYEDDSYNETNNGNMNYQFYNQNNNSSNNNYFENSNNNSFQDQNNFNNNSFSDSNNNQNFRNQNNNDNANSKEIPGYSGFISFDNQNNNK